MMIIDFFFKFEKTKNFQLFFVIGEFPTDHLKIFSAFASQYFLKTPGGVLYKKDLGHLIRFPLFCTGVKIEHRET